MSLAEKLLLWLSRDPKESDLPAGIPRRDPASALALFYRVYPDFRDLVRGKAVVDYGCGEGLQAIAMVEIGASSVLGIDTHVPSIEIAESLLDNESLRQRIKFCQTMPPAGLGVYDLVVSKDSMEHFADPLQVLRAMSSMLKPEGKLFITFGPPWYAPYGSHMHFFTRVPWVNIVFSERTVMRVRGKFRTDGAQHYGGVECGLGQLTLAKFERILNESGLRVEYSLYECVKGLNFLAAIPILRELFVNQVTVVLRSDVPSTKTVVPSLPSAVLPPPPPQ